MDKTAIKNFSIWARNKLIADITYKAGLLGITEEGIKDALPQSTQDAEFYDIGTKEPYAIHGEEIKQRKELVSAIRKKASQLEYKEAYRNVIEEVAYTWFNRLIAIRFMEVNDYMPAHIRVLSSEGGKKLEPDLVTTPFDAEIEFTQQETENILQMKNDNQVDALFRFLFIKQCNALNAYLPKLFEKTSDYTELLLNVSVTDQDGIVYHLTHDIKEDDFNISNIGEDGKPTGQVEIIGWMYQYYNTEPKDEAFALLKSNVKITKERIPAATQLFTPDWIVRYMVENSVGRLWLEGHENKELKKEWKYYLDEAEQEADVEEQLKAIREEYKNIKPEEIKVIDPCMGSGHILVYAFDVLMQIYESYGYSQRDAAKSIVENNIYGLDIDDRAFQLAYFAIMMKARSYNRRFLTLGIEPNLCAIQESNGIQYDKDMGDFLLSEEHRETLKYLLNTFVDAKEYGSILNVEKRDYDGFLKAWEQTAEATLENVVMIGWYNECNQIVPILAKQAKLLSEVYDIVITNPPYMGNGNMGNALSSYIKENYKNGRNDLFAVFIDRCINATKKLGFVSMITQHQWMFLSSYQGIREKVLNNSIINMAHLGARAFDEISGEVVQTTSFVLCKNGISEYIGTYVRVVEENGEKEKEKAYLERKQVFHTPNELYENLPGNPIVYWIESEILALFKQPLADSVIQLREGIHTGKNDDFIRIWAEVDFRDLVLGAKNESDVDKHGKWVPYNKGGTYKKWYGNNELVIGFNEYYRNKMAQLSGHVRPSQSLYFREGATWSALSSGKFGLRYYPEGHLFDSKGQVAVGELSKEILGLFNLQVYQIMADMIMPTLDYKCGDVKKLPYCHIENPSFIELVDENIQIAKTDWDSREISFDFKKHPLITYGKGSIEQFISDYLQVVDTRIEKTKENEEKMNMIFADEYGLSNTYSSVAYSDITIERETADTLIKSLLSYAVGCIMGRYSLDKDGVVCIDEVDNVSNTFAPDKDGIIPITDNEYFSDDLVGQVCTFIKVAFGEEWYDNNIIFIANHCGAKGTSAKDMIRNYFINDFYKDHCSNYSVASIGKRPIYWLFDSGKQNGFKALISMHRYNADTIGNLRVDYLHRMERIYENEINRMQDVIDNGESAREITVAAKQKEKLQKQLKECQEYDEKIGHLALSRIEIDLDDGVKVNYEKVQTANDGKKYQVLAKI